MWRNILVRQFNFLWTFEIFVTSCSNMVSHLFEIPSWDLSSLLLMRNKGVFMLNPSPCVIHTKFDHYTLKKIWLSVKDIQANSVQWPIYIVFMHVYKLFIPHVYKAHSLGAVEYTNCISAEWQDFLNKCHALVWFYGISTIVGHLMPH